MLKTLILSLSVLALIGIGFAYAGEKEVKIKADSISGKIIAVDMDGNAITLRDSMTNKDVIYVFNDTTTFYKDGALIKVHTLKPDDMVTLRLVPEEKNVILRLDTPVVVMEEDHDKDDDER